MGWGGGGALPGPQYLWGLVPLQGTPPYQVLEFQAVILSLHHFLPLVCLRTVVTHGQCYSGGLHKQTRGHPLHTPEELWTWCRRRDIIPIASYSPGQDKLIADFLSRGRVPPSEWTLHSQVMATIFRTFGPLHVDLFASALYAQLQRYCAQALDPAAWRIEPSRFGGRYSRGTPFPRPIPRILQKVRQDRATVPLIAPWWPKRTWFLVMITLVVGYPRTLPVRRDVISQPIPGTLHPRPSALHLTAWPLSGRPELRQAFLKGCGRCCPQPTGFYPRGVHSRLAGFFSWCESQGVDPRSAPLTDVAVF